MLDGELDASGNISSFQGSLGNDDPIEIGVDLNHSLVLEGLLDELSIWNGVISETQIQTSMDYELLGSEQGLNAYWNFNDGEGLT